MLKELKRFWNRCSLNGFNGHIFAIFVLSNKETWTDVYLVILMHSRPALILNLINKFKMLEKVMGFGSLLI